MARSNGIRRSRRIRRGGKMPGASGAVMKPHGRGVVKHASRGIRRHGGDGSLGQVVNAGSADSEVEQPSSADSASEGWIYVRGHRIKKAGLHFDCHGNMYVPDSEAEESGTEEPEPCGLDVATGMDAAVDLTPKVHDAVGVELRPEGDAVGGAVVEQVPDVAADQAPHADLPVKEPPMVATNKDVPPEVPEQLKEVLANMDPVYHDIFVKFILFIFTMKADISMLLMVFFNSKDCRKEDSAPGLHAVGVLHPLGGDGLDLDPEDDEFQCLPHVQVLHLGQVVGVWGVFGG